jgi:uncharacterized DUF497 family protein
VTIFVASVEISNIAMLFLMALGFSCLIGIISSEDNLSIFIANAVLISIEIGEKEPRWLYLILNNHRRLSSIVYILISNEVLGIISNISSAR